MKFNGKIKFVYLLTYSKINIKKILPYGVSPTKTNRFLQEAIYGFKLLCNDMYIYILPSPHHSIAKF